MHGRVGRREHADAAGPAHDRGQIGLVDPFGRQVVGAHRLVLDARVLELLRLPGDPQAAHVREVLRRADLLGDLVDALLRGQRGAVDAERDVVPEERGSASWWAGAAPATRNPPLRPLAPPAAVRASTTVQSTPRSARCQAQERPAMPAPITSTSVSHVAGERRALLVGIVVPEREQRGHRGIA